MVFFSDVIWGLFYSTWFCPKRFHEFQFVWYVLVCLCGDDEFTNACRQYNNNSSCGKVMLSQASVKNSVRRGRCTTPLGHTPWTHTPGYPTQSGSYCSGRYASYWNAFLYHFYLVDRRGLQGRRSPNTTRPRSNFFHFSTFGQIVDWRLHLWGYRTPVWKPWIHHSLPRSFTINFNTGDINFLIRFYFKYIFTKYIIHSLLPITFYSHLYIISTIN